MPTEVEELAGMLRGDDFRLIIGALDYLCGLSGSQDGLQFLITNEMLFEAIVALLSPERSKITLMALKTLINCIKSAIATNLFIKQNDNIDALFNLMESEDEQTVTDVSKVLANISRSRPGAEKVLHNVISHDRTLKLVTLFTSNKPQYYYLAHVFGNLCQISDGRQLILTRSSCIFQRVLPFLSHDNVLCRHGIANLVKNCCFETSCHAWLLEDPDFVSNVLMPLAGPGDELDDEDNESLPIDLQYLGEDKKREMCTDVVLSLVHSLHKLCNTKCGRLRLRECNVYLILREYHKTVEEESDIWREVHNVIQILIGDEPEVENLESVEVPEDVTKKLIELDAEDANAESPIPVS